MRLFEIDVRSIADELIFEMHHLLKEKNLLENSPAVITYQDFINKEKQYTIDQNTLNTTTKYYPLGLQSAPTGQLIILKYSDNYGLYLKSANGKLYFLINNKSIEFPQTYQTGDGFIDTLIYPNLQDLQHFLTTLGIQFSDWTIKNNKF